MHRNSYWWRAGHCIPLISGCRPSKQIQWNEVIARADKKRNQVCIQGPAHTLMWSAPHNSSRHEKLIPAPTRQNRGNNAPDLNTAAQSILNTKQDGIKWMHSGFYDCHCNVFLYYSQDLGDAYSTFKESQRLKITVLHYHRSAKKKL